MAHLKAFHVRAVRIRKMTAVVVVTVMTHLDPVSMILGHGKCLLGQISLPRLLMPNTLCKIQLFHSKDETGMLGSAYFFQCVSYDIADSGDLFRLSNPVHAVQRLILDHGVPLRLHEKDMVCSR